jgi:hypothetical protein
MMKAFACRLAALLITVSLPVATAHAQLEGMLNKGGSGNLKDLAGGLSGQSLTSGSMGNVAGMLEFCLKNNFLSGGDAAAVKDNLMGKLPGGAPAEDPGYQDGAKGLLHSSGGHQFDVSSIKADATKKVCDTVLNQGKSLLAHGVK